jgi:flagellar basal body-associated protein FliL
MTKKKLLIVPLVLLLLLGGAYKTVLAEPKEKAPEPKVHGTVYVLGKEFLVNLKDGRFAKVSAALVLSHDDTSTAPATGGHGAAPTPPEGYGAMSQEGVIRAIITDGLTNAADRQLIEPEERAKLQKAILKDILKHSDVKVEEVLFPDLTVQ